MSLGPSTRQASGASGRSHPTIQGNPREQSGERMGAGRALIMGWGVEGTCGRAGPTLAR